MKESIAVGTVPVVTKTYSAKGTVPTMLDAACSCNKPKGGLYGKFQ